jgi:hypothetical protein
MQSSPAPVESTGAEVDDQAAASAELRTPKMHRAKKSLNKECGWKDGHGAARLEARNHRGKKKNILESYRPSPREHLKER